MKKKDEDKTAAIVTILRPDDMTPEGRKEIAKWLRRQARFLVSHGDKMAKRFTAKYRYTEVE